MSSGPRRRRVDDPTDERRPRTAEDAVERSDRSLNEFLRAEDAPHLLLLEILATSEAAGLGLRLFAVLLTPAPSGEVEKKDARPGEIARAGEATRAERREDKLPLALGLGVGAPLLNDVNTET